MTRKQTKQQVPYSAGQMFDLVADVEAYPEFLPWCAALRLIDRDVKDGKGELTADMIVAYKVFRERFRSRVRLDREAGEIDVEYIEGPFRMLENKWRFRDHRDHGSEIEFDIAFEFKNSILQTAARMVIDKAFGRMNDAFIARAEKIYGNV